MATCRRVKFLCRMFSVLVIRLRSLRLLRVSGIVMRLRMFLLLITFLKASHSFRNRLLVICKNAYLFATMIMTSVSSPFSCCSGIVRLNLRSEERFSRNAETDLVCRLLLEKKKNDAIGEVCVDETTAHGLAMSKQMLCAGRLALHIKGSS